MSRYAAPSDLAQVGLRAGALVDVSTDDQQAALDSASTWVDGYLATKFQLPITSPSPDLVMVVCQIAAWRLMVVRGFNPDNPADHALRLGYEDAVSWLKQVAHGDVQPTLADSTPGGPTAQGGPFVIQPSVARASSADGTPYLTTQTPSPRGW